ncbi:alpha-mannosidase [Myxacorys almedinensis]|uniref:Alpha-mannosidase n=1 Tax=Myxacorys almedinensis A TaxID=2690445 RepID=A0A8J7Z3B6_9CYAN|nr:alpha-mannosidase [Myxacorys almedinensis]NDJ19229.1 alpha-mannosidase [Myxacorys almedinensis A]
MTDSVNQSIFSGVVESLRRLTQCDVQSGWHLCDRDGSITELPSQFFSKAELNEKGYLVWEKGRKVRWFYQEFYVPEQVQGYPVEGLTLRLALTWWAEFAEVFVNGEKVQEGDLFDHSCRVVLSQKVVPGEMVGVGIRLISPGHDIGGLMKSRLVYESDYDAIDPGFVADELAVLQRYLETFAPEELETVEAQIAQLEWSAVGDRTQFNHSLHRLRDRFHRFSPRIKQHTIYMVGHAHLDMAWLWDVEETWRAAERTFQSVLNLQNEFPDLTFCHSTPALYDWIEQNRPELFAQIVERVKEGRWEIVGGLWVEPEMNLIGAEAIARHILYGQRYYQEKFGEINRIAWLPDTFGFNWQLPQLLKQGGMDYFITQKFRWNDTNKYPYEVFNWQAPDGSTVFSLMSAPIGEGIDAIALSAYAWEWFARTGSPHSLWLPGVGDHGGGPTRDMLTLAQRWQKSPFFPTLKFTTVLKYLEALENRDAKAMNSKEASIHPKEASIHPKDSPIHPKDSSIHPKEASIHPKDSSIHPKEASTTDQDAIATLKHSSDMDQTSSPIPVWNDELYLEFHRGCYTTHGDQKCFNRRSEACLFDAELWSSLATIVAPHTFSYPKIELEQVWKQVLFNQFHDILPGSSITQVFVEANEAWENALYRCMKLSLDARSAIAAEIYLPTPPHPDAQLVVVFNSLNWSRSDIVQVSIPQANKMIRHWHICDLSGEAIGNQNYVCNPTLNSDFIGFRADIPAVGYRCYWLCPCETEPHPLPLQTDSLVLENEFLRATVDPTTGELATLFDKQHQREILSHPGNQLQAFRDEGQYWDAWNIDPNYAQHPLPPTKLLAIETGQQAFQGGIDQAQSAFESRVRVKRQLGQSIFDQTYMLQQHSPVLKISTHVDWRDRHVVVKAAFPLTVAADFATYEIAGGAILRSLATPIARTTTPQTEQEKAQWEVSALGWADLSESDYGVSILSDCKHGYDCKSDQIRLTLLRGSEFPDPEADLGHHEFTYAIYPHAGSWQSAQTVRHAQDLRHPLHPVSIEQPSSQGSLPPGGSLLDLQSENLILTALKQSEDNPEAWILRCYECHGKPANLTLKSDFGLAIAYSVDLLERPNQVSATSAPQSAATNIQPWQIRTFTLKPLPKKEGAPKHTPSSSPHDPQTDHPTP